MRRRTTGIPACRCSHAYKHGLASGLALVARIASLFRGGFIRHSWEETRIESRGREKDAPGRGKRRTVKKSGARKEDQRGYPRRGRNHARKYFTKFTEMSPISNRDSAVFPRIFHRERSETVLSKPREKEKDKKEQQKKRKKQTLIGRQRRSVIWYAFDQCLRWPLQELPVSLRDAQDCVIPECHERYPRGI